MIDIEERLERGIRIMALLQEMHDRATRMRLGIGFDAHRSDELWWQRTAWINRIIDKCCDEIDELPR